MPKRVMLFVGDKSLFMKKSGRSSLKSKSITKFAQVKSSQTHLSPSQVNPKPSQVEISPQGNSSLMFIQALPWRIFGFLYIHKQCLHNVFLRESIWIPVKSSEE